MFTARKGGFVGGAGVRSAGTARADTQMTSFEQTENRRNDSSSRHPGGHSEGRTDDVIHGRDGWAILGAHSGSEGDPQIPFGPLGGRTHPGEHDEKRNVARIGLLLSSTSHFHQHIHRALLQQLIRPDQI